MGGVDGDGEEHGHRGMSKLSTAFTVIFVITLAALLAQLLYILLRRRLFLRQATTNAVDSFAPSSKEQFLYFFCVRAQQTSNDQRPVHTVVANNNDYPSSDLDVDLLKLQGMFGPPRFLFTIKEEDEDQEREVEGGVRVINRVLSLKQCFDADDDGVEGDCGGGGTSVFSTPCASPAFFTPSASPVHVAVSGGSTDEEMGLPV